MRGHIRERGENRWALVVELPRDPGTGKRRQKWVTVQGTRRQAQRRLNELLTEVQAANYTAPPRQTLREYLEDWLTHYLPSLVKESTVRTYGTLLRTYVSPHLGALRLGDLRPPHLARLYQTLLKTGSRSGGPLRAPTVCMVHTTLSSALGYAVRLGLLASNPATQVSPPRRDHYEAAVLTLEQTTLLLEAAQEHSPWLHLVILLAVTTGLRRGEILGLRWSDIDWEHRRLTVHQTVEGRSQAALQIGTPKTAGSRRAVELPQLTLTALTAYQQHARLILCQGDGSPLAPPAVSSHVARLLRRLDLPGTMHTLRHTHATLLLVAGVHARVVSERLGHSTVKITLDRYSHVVPGLDRGAADSLQALLEGPTEPLQTN
ncbi:MAG: site-specific integrase [Armatimonadetes bacterium]|nr:site-specific integrase [Armatimonadota bacterium]